MNTSTIVLCYGIICVLILIFAMTRECYIGDNITFTMTINTRGGFEELGIDTLKVFRYDETGTLLTTDPRVIHPVKNHSTYTVGLKGDLLTMDAVTLDGGNNKFEVVGFIGNTRYTKINPLTSVNVTINKSEINYSLDYIGSSSGGTSSGGYGGTSSGGYGGTSSGGYGGSGSGSSGSPPAPPPPPPPAPASSGTTGS